LQVWRFKEVFFSGKIPVDAVGMRFDDSDLLITAKEARLE